MRVLLLSAFPREKRQAEGMLAGKKRLPGLPFRANSFRHPSHTILSAETGVGTASASRVLLRMLGSEKVDAVVSIGYCGALTDEIGVGGLVRASAVCLVEKKGVETLHLPDPGGIMETLSARCPIRPATFFTLAAPMKKRDIIRLVPPGTMLPVCDMETFALARVALSAGLSFFAIRGVSDGASEDIAFDPLALCDSEGTYRLSRAVRLFLSRPGLLAQAARLRRASKVASRNLACALDALLQAL